MKLGIVGLPNVGKSSLFNALTCSGAASENYPFCTIDPNIGIVSVPDERMNFLADMYHPAKFTPAIIEFVDIAGLEKGTSKGEGLGNKFLSHIREVDAILHVVRCFESGDVTHVEGSVGAARDAETVNFELIFADMETIEKRLLKSSKMIKSGDKKYKIECDALEKVKTNLEKGIFISGMDLEDAERDIVSELFLLTDKPILYVANVSEDDAAGGTNAQVEALKSIAESQNAEVMVVCAKLEEELSKLDAEERDMFLGEMGIERSGLITLVQKSSAVRIAGGLHKRRRISPSHRTEHLGEPGRVASASRHYRPVSHRDRLPWARRARGRPEAASCCRDRTGRRERPRRERSAVCPRSGRKWRGTLLGPAGRKLAQDGKRRDRDVYQTARSAQPSRRSSRRLVGRRSPRCGNGPHRPLTRPAGANRPGGRLPNRKRSERDVRKRYTATAVVQNINGDFKPHSAQIACAPPPGSVKKTLNCLDLRTESILDAGLEMHRVTPTHRGRRPEDPSRILQLGSVPGRDVCQPFLLPVERRAIRRQADLLVRRDEDSPVVNVQRTFKEQDVTFARRIDQFVDTGRRESLRQPAYAVAN
jgi:GTP-binding protein YchF